VYRHAVLARARVAVARRLERGTSLSGVPGARALAAVASRALDTGVVRRLAVPRGVEVVTVGGATLGGSGKTRLALSCARELALRGVRVALVGHAYGAAPGRARVVSPDDSLAIVGDEALACARALGGLARVVVAPARRDAIDLAASLADVLVLDGPLQLAPARAALSLLAVDADEPWGAGVTPPLGDLRASKEALLAEADHVVPVDAAPADDARVLALPRRFGLFSATARPHRLVLALARRGLSPVATVEVPDHGPAEAARAAVTRLEGEIDAWLATSKCALHLAALAPRRPVVVLEPWAQLSRDVRAALARLGTSPKTIVPAPTYTP
jgi:tetraacyldisaccharide 4'-kinase